MPPRSLLRPPDARLRRRECRIRMPGCLPCACRCLWRAAARLCRLRHRARVRQFASIMRRCCRHAAYATCVRMPIARVLQRAAQRHASAAFCCLLLPPSFAFIALLPHGNAAFSRRVCRCRLFHAAAFADMFIDVAYILPMPLSAAIYDFSDCFDAASPLTRKEFCLFFADVFRRRQRYFAAARAAVFAACLYTPPFTLCRDVYYFTFTPCRASAAPLRLMPRHVV